MANLPINLTGLVDGYLSVVVPFGRAPSANSSLRLFLRRSDFTSQDLIGTVTTSGGDSQGFNMGAGQITLDAPLIVTYSINETFNVTVTSGDGMNVTGYLQLPDEGGGIAPSVGQDLTTLNSVKQFLSLTKANHDTYISTLITRISARMEKHMGRKINELTITGEMVESAGFRYVSTTGYPIVSIEEVRERGNVLDPTEYEMRADEGKLFRKAGIYTVSWPYGESLVEIDYTYGFNPTPADLQQVADVEVARAFELSKQGAGRMGLEGSVLATGGSSTYITTAWLPESFQVLNTYRRLES